MPVSFVPPVRGEKKEEATGEEAATESASPVAKILQTQEKLTKLEEKLSGMELEEKIAELVKAAKESQSVDMPVDLRA